MYLYKDISMELHMSMQVLCIELKADLDPCKSINASESGQQCSLSRLQQANLDQSPTWHNG